MKDARKRESARVAPALALRALQQLEKSINNIGQQTKGNICN